MWISAIRTTFYKIWITQTESKRTTKGKNIPTCKLSFPVYIQIFDFLATVEE